MSLKAQQQSHAHDVAGAIRACELAQLDKSPKLERVAVRRSARELLVACIAMLPDFDALVVVLRNRGISYRRIAQSSGIACHKVIRRIESRALEALRNMLATLGVYRVADAI